MARVMVAMVAASFRRLFVSMLQRAVIFSASDPRAGHCQPMPPPETPGHSQAILAQSLVGSLLLSPGSWCTQGFVCALQESVSPVLWKFCNQIPLAFKVKFPGGSQSLCQIPRLGNLVWVPELSQQCKNFIGINCSPACRLSAGWFCGGAHTLCLPGPLQPEALSPGKATDDPCLHRRCSDA